MRILACKPVGIKDEMDLNALLPLQCYDGAAYLREYIQSILEVSVVQRCSGVQRGGAVGISRQRLTLKATSSGNPT
jgi:hypothetical protein